MCWARAYLERRSTSTVCLETGRSSGGRSLPLAEAIAGKGAAEDLLDADSAEVLDTDRTVEIEPDHGVLWLASESRLPDTSLSSWCSCSLRRAELPLDVIDDMELALAAGAVEDDDEAGTEADKLLTVAEASGSTVATVVV